MIFNGLFKRHAITTGRFSLQNEIFFVENVIKKIEAREKEAVQCDIQIFLTFNNFCKFCFNLVLNIKKKKCLKVKNFLDILIF